MAKPSIKPTERQTDFESSWQTLLSSGRRIIRLSETHHWYHARRLRAARRDFSDRHFARYPVGPAMQTHYADRLAELFALEQDIDHRLNQENNAARPSRHLHLVK